MKKAAILFITFLFISCTTNDSDTQNSQIIGYKIDYNSSPGYNFVRVGHLLNGKLYSETHEDVLNGISQEPVTEQIYFYNADGTVNHYKQGEDRMVYLYYDAGQNLVGAKLVLGAANAAYYRFRHISANVVIFERLNLLYDDPNAVTSQSIVLQFNADNDVIMAGLDTNSDNVADSQINTFSYTNHNIASATFWDGSIQNFDYSNIIENFNHLREISVGKKNLRIISGECYHVLYNSDYFLDNIGTSNNVLLEDANSAVYNVLPNNFYTSKTEAVTGGGTKVTTFFFN